MNFAFGEIIDLEERDSIVDQLEAMVAKTLSQKTLSSSMVIDTCDNLANSLGNEHVQLLSHLGISKEECEQYLCEAKIMLSREYLLQRMEKELGTDHTAEYTFSANNGKLQASRNVHGVITT